MKNLKLGFLSAFVFSMFFITSCDDACKDVTCLNGGTCLEGICQCPTGYEGTDCGTAYNAKFAGDYTFIQGTSDTISFAAHTAVITLSATDPSSMTIGGLYDNPAGVTVTASVNSDSTNNFSIPEQLFNDAFFGTKSITGTGSLGTDGNTITLDFVLTDVTDNSTFDNVSLTYRK